MKNEAFDIRCENRRLRVNGWVLWDRSPAAMAAMATRGRLARFNVTRRAAFETEREIARHEIFSLDNPNDYR